jgi:hypothetical protein
VSEHEGDQGVYPTLEVDDSLEVVTSAEHLGSQRTSSDGGRSGIESRGLSCKSPRAGLPGAIVTISTIVRQSPSSSK